MNSGRRQRISLAASKDAPAFLPFKRPLIATVLTTMTPLQQNLTIKDIGELKIDTTTRLQVLKKDMEHNHVSTLKQIDVQSSKLKKRVKQEAQALITISEAVDIDWRNFLADFDEVTGENKTSVEAILTKLDASESNFTKTFIPELLKSVEVSLDNIKNRFTRPVKSARRLGAREKVTAKLTEMNSN